MDFFRAICERDCEGIVAKHRLGTYTARPATWYKVLNPAYTQKRGRREMFQRQGDMAQLASTTGVQFIEVERGDRAILGKWLADEKVSR